MTFSLGCQHKLEKGTGLASGEHYCVVSGLKPSFREEEVRKRRGKQIFDPSQGQVARRGIMLPPQVLPQACLPPGPWTAPEGSGPRQRTLLLVSPVFYT